MLGTGVYGSTLRRFFLSRDESIAFIKETFDYDLRFDPIKGGALLGYAALEPYGWYFENVDEKKVLDGTHGLYVEEGNAE